MDELEQQGSEQSQETPAVESNNEQVSQGEQTSQTTQDLIDLESVKKFRFGGVEWTPDAFRNSYMMQQDYTKKTQALAEERKYYDNLTVDLKSVSENPSLINEFKRVYPEKFHRFLEYVQGKAVQQQATDKGVSPELMERLTKVEQAFQQQQIAAINAQLDATFSTLSKKFPMGDENAVLARAEFLHSKGEKLTDAVWEKLWKESHDKIQKIAEQHYSAKVKEQKNINQRNKDVPPGGGIPGQAPKSPRTIKEASTYALQELEGN